MLFDEAVEKHKKQYFSGKNKNKKREDYVFPYNFLYLDDEFIQIEIPLNLTETQETDRARVDKYIDIIKEQNDMEPIWVSIGKKLKDGTIVRHWHLKFYVLDGNHRTEAYKKLNHKMIKTMIPKSHFVFLEELENGTNS